MSNPNPHVYFTDKQIKKRHFNKETGKYEGYAHSYQKNKDGTPIQMVHVLLPSADKREFQFEPDKNGIDRNLREAYIQVPLDAIKDTKEKRRKVLYLNNPKAYFTVYFKGERINSGERAGQFDAPEKYRVTVKQMQEIYPTRLVSKIKSTEKKEKMTTQKQEKDISKEKKDPVIERKNDERSV